MPIYSESDFDDQTAGPSRPSSLFTRNRSLYSILGGRKVADLLLWRNKKLSASILAGFTIIWFLFEVVELHFITLACYLLMTFMLILFTWVRAADFFRWTPPRPEEIRVSETTARQILSRVNKLLRVFYIISSGQDLGRFFLVLASIWVLSIFGSYSSALNVLYTVFLCLMTIPVLYERYEREVHYIATQGKGDMQRLYRKLDTKFLSKIPRGPVKDKKFM